MFVGRYASEQAAPKHFHSLVLIARRATSKSASILKHSKNRSEMAIRRRLGGIYFRFIYLKVTNMAVGEGTSPTTNVEIKELLTTPK